MSSGGKSSSGGSAVAAYALLAVALFAPLGAAGRLAGNCDTWLAIALSNGYAAHVGAWLEGASAGTAMHPWGMPFAYGESSPLGALLFAFFKLAGMGDVGAYTAWLCTLFALSAWGVFLLARSFELAWGAAFLAGFAFSVSNFTFANIDDSIVTCFFLPCLSLAFLRQEKPGSAALVGALQAYLSVYVFIYQTLALGLYLALSRTIPARRLWLPAGIYLALPLPLLAAYVSVYLSGGTYNLLAGEPTILLEGRGLGLTDLLASLPGGVLHGGALPEGPEFWLALRKKAFLGFGLLGLAGLGALRWREGRAFALGLCGLGLLLAWGQPLHLGGLELPPPVLWVYELLPILAALRLPLRAYFLTSLGLSLLAAGGGAFLLARLQWKGRTWPALALLAFCALHAAENLPVPLLSYEGAGFASAPPAYLAAFEGEQDRVILDLPTTTFRLSLVGAVHKDLYAYNREVIYMNWQTQHRQNIVGGIHGYDFEARAALLEQVRRVPEADALEALSDVGVEFIVFHPRLVLPGEERLGDALRSASRLDLVVDRLEIQVYRLAEAATGG